MTLTVQQVAERYGVGEHTALGWIRSGELRAINVGRRIGSKRPRWRVTEESLAAFETLRMSSVPSPLNRRRRKRPTDVIAFYAS